MYMFFSESWFISQREVTDGGKECFHHLIDIAALDHALST